MSLNCKQGDLARIVSADCAPGYLGWVVHCVAGPYAAERGPAWVVEPRVGDFGGVYDFALRPLDNPGDEAVDSRDIKLGEAMRTQVREGADA